MACGDDILSSLSMASFDQELQNQSMEDKPSLVTGWLALTTPAPMTIVTSLMKRPLSLDAHTAHHTCPINIPTTSPGTVHMPY